MFGAALRKSNPFSAEAQGLIEEDWREIRPEVEEACVEVINRALERRRQRKRDTIIVEVEVDYDRLPQEMIEALGGLQEVQADVVAQIPRREQGKKKVMFEFFRLCHNPEGETVALERARRRLILDVYAQIAVNQQDESFAAAHPNSMSWRDAGNRWCNIDLYQYKGDLKRKVRVGRGDTIWGSDRWFGGVHKESSAT